MEAVVHFKSKVGSNDESGAIKRLEDGYGSDLSVFDNNCLKGVEMLEIGNGCFKNMIQFLIDGLNELKSVKIGDKSFELEKNGEEGSKCVIMNCDQLSEIHIEDGSFYWYKSFELKNLPSLISIQLDRCAFCNCKWIVFDSMNDWMNDKWDLIRLQSIILGNKALYGDNGNVETNELIMKSMNGNYDWLIRSPFSIYIQRRLLQFRKDRQSAIE